MWKVFVCLIVLGLVWDSARGQGTVILSGTLLEKDGTNCLQDNGNSVAAETDNTCVDVVVVETGTTGEYTIQKLEGTRAENVLKLQNPTNAFGASADGSTIVFYDVSGDANLNTVAALTVDTAPFVIRLSTEAAGDCLSAAGMYTTGGVCNTAVDLWYFKPAACTVTDCTTCNADVLICDACPDNQIVNSGGTACEACNAFHAECTACSHTSGTSTCTTCNAGYITDATDGCAACGTGEISANNECTSCPATQIVDTNACTACGNGQTSHSDRAQCVDICTVDNCLYCDGDAATCDQCDSGYVLDTNTCTACDENEIAVEDTCTGCSTALHAQCTACNEDSGTPTCTACNAGFITDDADGCAACDAGKISENNECTSCEPDEYVVNNVCTACDEGQTSHSNRVECVDMCTIDNCLYCDNAAATCMQCITKYSLANDVCTVCEDNQIVDVNNDCMDCGDNETPNTAHNACVEACTDNNCMYCDDGTDTCGTCNDGYTLNNGACEEPTTTTESMASDMTSFVSVLILAVLTGRLMA